MKFRALASGFLLCTFGAAASGLAAPPLSEIESAGSAAGASGLSGGGARAPASAADALTWSWLERRPTGVPSLYIGAGVQAENYIFSRSSTLVPARLQDYAAVVSLEYFEGDEAVASVVLRPGWYFAQRMSRAAWDIPVDAVTGLPVSHDFSGVIGVSNARFFHHPLPVIGLVWTPRAAWRIEAIYPEPAVTYILDPATSIRLGGELSGGGFFNDSHNIQSAVEFSSYRVGLEAAKTWPRRWRLSLAVGVEVERSLDYFRGAGRLHGSGAPYIKLTATRLR